MYFDHHTCPLDCVAFLSDWLGAYEIDEWHRSERLDLKDR